MDFVTLGFQSNLALTILSIGHTQAVGRAWIESLVVHGQRCVVHAHRKGDPGVRPIEPKAVTTHPYRVSVVWIVFETEATN